MPLILTSIDSLKKDDYISSSVSVTGPLPFVCVRTHCSQASLANESSEHGTSLRVHGTHFVTMSPLVMSARRSLSLLIFCAPVKVLSA